MSKNKYKDVETGDPGSTVPEIKSKSGVVAINPETTGTNAGIVKIEHEKSIDEPWPDVIRFVSHNYIEVESMINTDPTTPDPELIVYERSIPNGFQIDRDELERLVLLNHELRSDLDKLMGTFGVLIRKISKDGLMSIINKKVLIGLDKKSDLIQGINTNEIQNNIIPVLDKYLKND